MRNLLSCWLAVLLAVGITRADVVYSADQNIMGKQTTLRVWAKETKAKFVAESGSGSGMEIIATEGGDLISIVLPDQRVYFRMTREKYKVLQGRRVAQHDVTFQSGKREELTVDQPGGKVAGIETRYYKFRLTGTITENGREEQFEAIQEFWTAPSIPNIKPELAMLTNQVTGIPAFDELLYYGKFKGLPLKRLITLSLDGKPLGTSSVEVKTLTQASVPESVFTIPSDYTRKLLPGESAEQNSGTANKHP